MMRFIPSHTPRYLLFACLCGILASVLSSPAVCQGFMVRPLLLELAPRPGDVVAEQVQIQNTAKAVVPLKAFIEPLDQLRNGALLPFDADNYSATGARIPPPIRSCGEWMTVTPETLQCSPIEPTMLTVRLQVPHSARGFYSACLVIQTVPDPDKEGNPTIIELAVPVLVSVQGSQAKENIKIAGVGMSFCPTAEERPGTTFVYMQARNAGETFNRVRGQITVQSKSGKNWRRVTDMTMKEQAVVPGRAINIIGDLKRRLTSGRYRLLASLYINGRRGLPFVQEIDFTGDPSVTNIAADISLEATPQIASAKTVQGSTHSMTVSLRHPGGEPIQVHCSVEIPPELKGITMGNLKSEMFSCADWISVSPDTFTLNGGAKRNLRVSFTMPVATTSPPNFYANLRVTGTYADGQSVGETVVPIQITDQRALSEAKAQAIRITLAQQEGEKYVVCATFGNIGNIHFTPQATASLGSLLGSEALRVPLESLHSRMLPLCTAEFSGVLDFSSVKPGVYQLRVDLDYANKQITKRMPLRVDMVGPKKIITVGEQPPAELPPPSEVK